MLGLQASTPYAFTAVGTWADGGILLSNVVAFTTSALPTGLHSYMNVSGQPSGGYTLLSYIPSNPTQGTEYAPIVNGAGAVVWYLTLPAGTGMDGDFERQPDGTYTVATITSSSGAIIPGLNDFLTIFRQYDVLGNPLATWSAPDTNATDEHDFRLLPDGSALLGGLDLQQENLSLVVDGGLTDAGVYDFVLERVSPSGEVLFSWNSSVLPLTGEDPSNTLVNQPVVDGYHGNSIDIMDGGDYLVSFRNLSEAVKIDPTDGGIVWILGGASSSFTFVDAPYPGGFRLQHTVRELPNGHIILLDDGYLRDSRAVEYALDETAKTATLVWSAQASNPGFAAYAFGSAQRLENGNTLVCYGTGQHVQEVTPDGGVIWDLSDPNHDYGFYRAYRLDSLY